MTDDALAVTDNGLTDEAMDAILQQGDLSKLTIKQRSQFIYKMAERLGLNPLTQPFNIINLNGKLTLYANRTASDQLRQIHNISSRVLYSGPLLLCDPGEIRDTLPPKDIPRDDSVYQVIVLLQGSNQGNTTTATNDTDPHQPQKPAGPPRTEMAVGCVGIAGLKGEALANAIMKCHTKALRRGTLSFAGLGFLDELEIESVKSMEAANPPSVGNPRRVVPSAEVSKPVPAEFKPLPSAPAPIRVK